MGSAAVEGDDRAIRCVQEAMSSPLLNDNNIYGAKYVLLNITYGEKEVLMDEITEITDYIQDEAGSTADVIWGHGYDPSLGDKLSVTLIATGFKTSDAPLTGFDKAPEKIVRSLNEEPKKEITQQMQKPTEQVSNVEPANSFEPYIKITNNDVNTNNTVKPDNIKTHQETLIESSKSELVWEISAPVNENTTESLNNIETVFNEPTKIVHNLEDESHDLEQNTRISSRITQSPEDQQRLNNERMERIQSYTQKLKLADGLSQLEKEPAFERRNIQLDNSKPSADNTVSRFGVSGNGDSTSLRSNNSFLHDNVD
jgi:cell division protein FtsZ